MQVRRYVVSSYYSLRILEEEVPAPTAQLSRWTVDVLELNDSLLPRDLTCADDSRVL